MPLNWWMLLLMEERQVLCLRTWNHLIIAAWYKGDREETEFRTFRNMHEFHQTRRCISGRRSSREIESSSSNANALWCDSSASSAPTLKFARCVLLLAWTLR